MLASGKIQLNACRTLSKPQVKFRRGTTCGESQDCTQIIRYHFHFHRGFGGYIQSRGLVFVAARAAGSGAHHAHAPIPNTKLHHFAPRREPLVSSAAFQPDVVKRIFRLEPTPFAGPQSDRPIIHNSRREMMPIQLKNLIAHC